MTNFKMPVRASCVDSACGPLPLPINALAHQWSVGVREWDGVGLWTGVCHSCPPHPLKAAAAAKSLQSCPTLCDPIDGSPPGSPIPGIKNTGVGCHFLLQCMKVKSESEVAQSCLTLHDPMDCSLPCSSVHGVFQARVLQWGAIAFSSRLLVSKIKQTILSTRLASLLALEE